ncbi:CotS family spore coat protein [Desulfolucanica intricata]|uniref:CotS family spore coat protein n=1 Tax=Desulfolucanica intricata TaxID=1285191 RepID=UPI00082F396D|nr:CotS family spore coat protein [Desulfolucanica intricata]
MENIEEKILKEIFSLQVNKIQLIADKGKKKVWKVVSPNGIKVLKKIPVSESRARFIVSVIRHLVRQGVKIPQIITTYGGMDYYLSPKKEIYLLMEWIEGTKPDFNMHLEYVVKAMANFHKGLYDFDIKSFVHVPDRRGTWINSYKKRQKKLLNIKLCTLENNEVAQLFLANLDYFLKKAYKAQRLLEQSYYSSWVLNKKICICHQDFIPQNLKIGDHSELYVFDLDTLVIDVPALDLRKLINNVCKSIGNWDSTLVKSIVRYYNSINPLTSREWEVVFIDLMYPHLFYSLINNYCSKPVPGCLKNLNYLRLKKAINFEQSKDEFLEEYIGSKKNILLDI